MPDPTSLTERQQKWFASVRAGLERDTGRTVEAWAEIARTCPETAHRKRLAWMKANHGLGQNHASIVLNAAFPPQASWSSPDALVDALWSDPPARALFERVRDLILPMPDVIMGQRKSFTAFSRKVQFAAVRPAKGGVMLGLAIGADRDPRLVPTRSESWSERLTAMTPIDGPAAIDAGLAQLIEAAWERS